MRIRWFIVALLLVFPLVAFWPGAQAADDAFIERVVWEKDINTSTNLLTNSLKPSERGTSRQAATRTSTIYRMTVAIVSTASNSILYMNVKNTAAGSAENFALNGGTTLTAGNAYSFSWQASAGFEYNFQVGTSTRIGLLTVDSGGN